MNLSIDTLLVLDRAGDLFPQQLTKALSQPMNRHLHGRLIHSQSDTDLRVGPFGPGKQVDEYDPLGVIGGLDLATQPILHMTHDLKRPAPFEQSVRRISLVDLERISLLSAFEIERQGSLTAPSLQRRGLVAFI